MLWPNAWARQKAQYPASNQRANMLHHWQPSSAMQVPLVANFRSSWYHKRRRDLRNIDKRTRDNDIKSALKLARIAQESTIASTLKTRPWDRAEHLETEVDIAAYLQAAFAEGDPSLVAAALCDNLRAKGIAHSFAIVAANPLSLAAAEPRDLRLRSPVFAITA